MAADLRFLTKNDGKYRELSELIDSSKFRLIQDPTEIHELQTEDMAKLVRDKVLKAFELIRRPLIVDHTALEFDLLNGFPSGLTSVFYDKLRPEGISKVIGQSSSRGVTAITLLAHCDGRNILLFEGKIRGEIAEQPRGNQGFQWDSVFIPDGYKQTFAELGDKKKNEISMRRLAFEKLAKHLGT